MNLSLFTGIRYASLVLACSFIPAAVHAAPGWTMEKFPDVSGVAVGNLTAAASYYSAPTPTILSSSAIPSYTGDNYGTRIRGYVTAPVSGDYIFWVSGDDAAQLYLSPDDNPALKQLIAFNNSYTDPQKWDKYPTQKSRLLTLVAGSRYYIEVLHKEGASGDHLAVAWTPPNSTRSLIPLTAMETFDDVLPATPAGLTVQTFPNIIGSNVSDLTFATNFPHSPSTTSIIATGQSAVNVGDQMGTRTRGWIVPEISGNFTFWISGDETAQLFLSPSSNPADKQMIAQCSGATLPLQWTKSGTQKSRTLTLTAGKAYYVEVLHKEGTGSDHYAIAWTPPGGALEILPNSVLRTWAPHPSDLDDDQITDTRESAFGLDSSVAADGYADSDGDSIPNNREYLNGSNPSILDSVDGYLNDQVWFNVVGDKLTKSTYKIAATRPCDIQTYLIGGQSSDVGDNYVRRYRGFIKAPLTGQYQFWATADDDVDLYLSTSSSKFNLVHIIQNNVLGGGSQFDIDPSQKSALITLKAGEKYYFEMWHKEGLVSGNAAVAWKIPGGSRQIIPASNLSSFGYDPDDLDDDDLPDSYEIANGLNPNDDGSSPNTTEGAYGDLDGDGLTNRAEWKSNTAANLVDTDGDGVSDYDEINFFGSATLANAIGAFIPVATIPGDSYTTSFGEWSKLNGTARQVCRRGSVTYPITVSTSGVYALKFAVSSINDGAMSEQHDFHLKLNGQHLEYKTINILPDSTSTLAILTPWLQAGEIYNLELFVDNSYNWRRVSIDSLQILAAGGIDSNVNGTPDWVDIRIHDTNCLDKSVILSKTSPAIVEGNVKHINLLNSGVTPVTKAPNGRFFADVLLAPNTPANIEFVFENGAVSQSALIHWLPTNLLQETSITIRQGDSLLLTAFNDAENASLESYTITANGQVINSTADQPSQVMFSNPGTTGIQLIHVGADGSITQRTVSINVLACVNIESPLCINGYPRTWTHPVLPAGVRLQFDQEIASVQGAAANIYTLGTNTPVNKPFLIRQGADGPILGAGEVKSVSMRSTDMTGALVTSSDATYQIVEMPVIVYGDIGNSEIRCHIIIGGVTYMDGTTTQSIFKHDFDVFGNYTLKFKKIKTAHSNCHRFEIIQNSLNILK